MGTAERILGDSRPAVLLLYIETCYFIKKKKKKCVSHVKSTSVKAFMCNASKGGCELSELRL